MIVETFGKEKIENKYISNNNFLDKTVYTFPNVAPYVFLVCKLCHSVLRTVGLVKGSEVVSVNKLAATFIIMCLVLMAVFHLVLNFIGL